MSDVYVVKKPRGNPERPGEAPHFEYVCATHYTLFDTDNPRIITSMYQGDACRFTSRAAAEVIGCITGGIVYRLKKRIEDQ